jgi:16S rRNA (uracil1498-N3)-methyltransferase
VLRFVAGDAFVAFDPDTHLEADAVIVSTGEAPFRIGEQEAVVIARFETPRPAAVIARAQVTWVHGLAKGDKCDAIARDATELGATRVVFAPCARSVARPKDAAQKVRRWSRVAEQAARQCGRADPPEIALATSWEEALASCAGARICLHTHATSTLTAKDLATTGPVAFAAGPEGGLTDEEVATAERLGWSVRSLGAFVLRTETVPSAVLGALLVHGP